MLAGPVQLGALHQVVQGPVQAGDRQVQALALAARILGHDLGQSRALLVQHGAPDGEPGGEDQPLQPGRQQADAFRRPGLVARHEVAAGDELGHHHGGGLERLDLLLGVLARRAVLHHQHADHPAAPQDRHAHQGTIDLLARLGPIGEIGMGLGIGQRQGPGVAGDIADQPLADPEPGPMHGLQLQPFGGEELQHLAGAHHIGRADLRHHAGGDGAHDAAQPLLRGPALGHEGAQPTEQQPGAGRTAALSAH